MLPLLGNCQTNNLNLRIKNQPRTLKPYDYFEKNNMSFFTFDYYQTTFLLKQKKIKDLYTKRLSLQDSLISNNDSVIKKYKTILALKQQQLDSTYKSLEHYNNIVNIQKNALLENKYKIRNKNIIIITLVGTLGTTFFFVF